MEPLDDKELKQLLRQWDAPPAPATLKRRVFGPQSRWSWLLTGSFRVPVPVAFAAVILVAFWIYYSRPGTPEVSQPVTVAQPASVSLTDFKPVRQLEPILVFGGQR